MRLWKVCHILTPSSQKFGPPGGNYAILDMGPSITIAAYHTKVHLSNYRTTDSYDVTMVTVQLPQVAWLKNF